MNVFGYGSLAVPPRSGGSLVTAPQGSGAETFRLEGWRRSWGVAMDNSVAIPGYKVYEDPSTGERPPLFVAFLDLVADPEAAVEGTLLEVRDLAPLDRRERNYDRVEVADGVFAYVGSAAGRERFDRGVRDGRAVITAEYLARVPWAGDPPLPVCDLRRRDL